jgi:hypothetical protein
VLHEALFELAPDIPGGSGYEDFFFCCLIQLHKTSS